MIKAERLKFNHKAFDAVRKSTDVMDFVEGVAKEQMEDADGWYNVKNLKKRGSVLISCADKATEQANKKSNELIKRIKRRKKRK